MCIKDSKKNKMINNISNYKIKISKSCDFGSK